MRPTTRDYSVKFGRGQDMGTEEQKAFPFIYSLVNRNDDTWLPVAAGVQPSLANIGPTVPANSRITHNVVLDPDYNFKMLSIKYTVYKWLRPSYLWYTVSSGTISDGMDPGMDHQGTPLSHYVGITLSFQGSGSVFQYGGPDFGPLAGGARLPLPLDVIQGYEYGYLRVRSPRLLPRQGHLVFEITNSFSSDIVIGAAIYGMKIRI